jgi:hypothetical protein
MRDFAIQEPLLRPGPCTDDGITTYLHTMFAVAHTPGASHWCTPGHNRGRASAALALAAPRPAVMAIRPPIRLRPTRAEEIDG